LRHGGGDHLQGVVAGIALGNQISQVGDESRFAWGGRQLLNLTGKLGDGLRPSFVRQTPE
jgi:hypothetical protein